jgi:multidrug efflux pump subunit AcrA (membrane-fusion protein)
MRSATLVLLLPLIAACSVPEPPVAPLKLVRTLKVGADGTANSALDRAYSGEVRARIETTLGFRIGGKIVERRADVGQAVKAGQVLARLDPADAALQATQAEAQRALAAADLARYRDLKAKNFISASALDARETSLKAAEAQAQLAKNQAGYTTLVADRAGVIGQVLAEPGQVVSVGKPCFDWHPTVNARLRLQFRRARLAVSSWASRPKSACGPAPTSRSRAVCVKFPPPPIRRREPLRRASRSRMPTRASRWA